MQKRIGWCIYEEMSFIPLNFTPEEYRHIQQVKADRIEKALEKKVEVSACTDELQDV